MRARICAVAAGDRWVAQVARLTRAAFAVSDPLPGLPAPDGGTDDDAGLSAEVRAGATIWVALDDEGRLVGSLRVHEHPDDSWELHRVAVAPWARGLGVAAALVTAVEECAGARRMWLHAVVERCLAPVYAAMGFRVVAVKPSPDKPLSEVIMQRSPGEPRRAERLADSWIWPRPRPTVAWFVADDRTVAVPGRHASVRSAAEDGADRLAYLGDVRFAGVDADLSGRDDDRDVVVFPAARADVAAHLMPRAVDPAVFAMWRCSPGREVAAADLHARERTP
ncbi:MAG: GNAT family N-acetyltransferase [Micromonosporaceae bacterium]